MIGRDDLLAHIDTALDVNTMVVLSGPPGVGKTTLARAARADFWCDLTLAADAHALWETLARALGISRYDESDPLATLRIALGSLEPGSRIVLDNAEAALDDPTTADALGALRDATPHIAWLVTSRTIPEGVEVTLFEVPSLATEDAEELFLTRAQLTHAALEPSQREAVTSLVEALDRLPLALELAAARAHLLQPDEIEQRLDEQRFALLSGDTRRPGLAASIERSWEHLGELERRALGTLASFNGDVGFALAERALTAIVPERPGLDLIDALARHSLVFTSRTPHGTRINLLSAVRAFVLERLDDLAQLDIQRSLSEVVGAYAHDVRRVWLTPQGYETARAARHEHAHFEDVIDRETDRRPHLALTAASILFEDYARVGPVRRLTTLRERIEQGIDPETLEHSADRLARHALLANLHILESQDFERARHHARAALAEPFTPDAWGSSLRMLNLLGYAGRSDEAREALDALPLEQVPEEFRALLDASRGVLAMTRGDSAQAAEHFRRSLHVQRHHGNLFVMLECVHHLATCLNFFGEYREQASLLEGVLERLAPGDDHFFEIIALTSLANAHHYLGDLDASDEVATRAVAVARRTGYLINQVGPLVIRIHVALDRGQLDVAEELVAVARPLGANHSFWNDSVIFLSAMIALFRGQLELGAERIDASLEHAPTFPAGRNIVSYCYRAVVAHLLGDEETRDANLARSEEDRHAVPRRHPLMDMTRQLCADAPVTIAPKDFFERALLRIAQIGATPPRLLVEPEGRWFELSGDGDSEAQRVNLGRRGPMKRILVALTERHLEKAGPIEVFEMFDLAWGEEHVEPELAASRVYNNVAGLRKLGLGEWLLGGDLGYELDGLLVVAFANS